MRRIAYRYQRTLARPTEVAGRRLRHRGPRPAALPPGPAGHRRRVRPHRPARPPPIPARADSVTDTHRRTTLGPRAAGVTLVEHVLAALAGLRIDNCVIETRRPGAARPRRVGPRVRRRAHGRRGRRSRPSRRPILGVDRTDWSSRRDGATIALHPGDGPGLRMSYILDYGPVGPIPRQAVTARR